MLLLETVMLVTDYIFILGKYSKNLEGLYCFDLYGISLP
jgi:hypothetical protein